MDKLTELFVQRRIWAALIPAAVIAANAFGIPLTEDLLTSTGDKVVVAVSGLLALLSYFKPKRP